MNAKQIETTRQIAAALVEHLVADSPELDAAVARLAAQHGDVSLRVLRRSQAYDGQSEIDLLVGFKEVGTLLMSYGRDSGLPWPLRSVFRWRDGEVASINGRAFTFEELAGLLDFMWSDRPLLRAIVDSYLIDEAIAERGLRASDDELQDAMDAYRAARGLVDPEATEAWLKHQGLSHSMFEEIIEKHVASGKLRDQIVGGQERAHFERASDDYRGVFLAELFFPTRDQAAEAWRRLAEAPQAFFELAQEALVDGQASRTPSRHAWAHEIAPEEREQALLRGAGAVLAPRALGNRFVVTQVQAVLAPRYDEATRRAIRDRLFDAWLAERHAKATIEWYWGRREDTQQLFRERGLPVLRG
jgi:putative peptide maturation system protein